MLTKIGAMVLALTVFGCGGPSTSGAGGAAPCSPGTVQPCPGFCFEETDGQQECLSDGTFGECGCPLMGAGGAGPMSGSSVGSTGGRSGLPSTSHSAVSSVSSAAASSSSTSASSAASSSASTGTGGPLCAGLPVGSSIDCYPYGVDGLVGFGPCSPPGPVSQYICSDGSAPSGFDDCYAGISTDPDAFYCSRDVCVRYSSFDGPLCATISEPPNAWQCARGTPTSTLPPGCTGPFGNYATWCCP